MRSSSAIIIAVCGAAAATMCDAFTPPPSFSTPIRSVNSARSQNQAGQSQQPILFANRLHNDCDEDLLIPSLSFLNDDTPNKDKSISSPSGIRQQLLKAGKQIWNRMDTLKAAGLYDNEEDGLIPMQSGFKRNIGLLVGAFLFKWYRARFINKIPVWDRQPQWNMVVTSPEQEKELHAYSCKNCGATIFIARHREWFFKGGNTECTNCGAKGKDNFVDIRGEVIDSIDDDYFDYESPLDFVSAAERRRLVKQAGGDEELAKKLAIDNVMKNDSEQIEAGEGSTSGGGESESSTSAAEQKKKKGSKKSKKEPEDIFDELDMDM